ncbi:MAG: MarR family transcriptional regulator [Chloroflexi bacterium]|nr:MarR family transcriptional regulator [Chloroflexota bacterium]
MTLSSQAFDQAWVVFSRLMRAGRLKQAAWIEMDLTMAQTKALFVVCTVGMIHGRDLAQALGIGQPAVSKLVDHLVERGYVRRDEDTEDRRLIWLRPTDSGQALYDRMTVTSREALRAILDTLDERELALVTEALTILARAAEGLAKQRGSPEEVEGT